MDKFEIDDRVRLKLPQELYRLVDGYYVDLLVKKFGRWVYTVQQVKENGNGCQEICLTQNPKDPYLRFGQFWPARYFQKIE